MRWVIKERPGYEVEKTIDRWVLWGPCHDIRQSCRICKGEGIVLLASCGFVPGTTNPDDVEMACRVIRLSSWTPIRVKED